MDESVNLAVNPTGTFNWIIAGGSSYASSWVYLTAGDSISISLMTNPNDLAVEIGMEDVGNHIDSVTDTNAVLHEFFAVTSGMYRFRVLNPNTETVSVNGFYYTSTSS